MSFTKTVFLPVEPAEAFELITQPERLRRWQTVTARVDLHAGGEYRWTIVPGHHAAGTFTEVEPGRRLAFTWGWEGSEELPPGASNVSITLTPAEGGTSLTFVHEGLNAEQAASHAEGWNHFLGRLVVLAETGDAGLDEWAAAPAELNQLTGAEAGYAALTRVLAAVGPEAAGLRTPCEDFDVAALTDHLRRSIVGIGKAIGAALPEDDADAPAEVRIAAVVQPTLEAFGGRGLDGEIDMGFAVLPAALVGNILNLEFLVHAWDYATALGRTLEVSPELSEYVLGLAKDTISDQVRAGGSFAEETVVDESAHALDRLVAFTGRVPAAS
ncbi:TIGR03086 family metal-binding protein [Sinomonas sp. ASV322]|uniref:TIGR03086 family metal-binding protein n=1 Tax=Sinomonas sp. ASV322 TaxID=3041920 RepID=UPI0027DAFBED|nr:TIGR03086 family metal-binding protein [Sinomonas sp. ASV322]MDQ4504556.1 TIGR03086 family metal-binding protein [Sinomonas sp. ASV322]